MRNPGSRNDIGIHKSISFDISRVSGFIQSISLLAVLVLITSILSTRFFSYPNIINLIRQVSINLIISAGMTFVIISGEIDLSVGSLLILTSTVVAKLLVFMPVFPSVLLGLLIGPLFGYFHGIVISRGRVSSFIVTLGTLMIGRSLAFLITDGKVLHNIPKELTRIDHDTWLGLPIVTILVAVIYLLCHLVLRNSPYGKKIYSIGSDTRISRLVGIQVGNTKTTSFVICGFFASLSGIVILARIGAIQAYTGKGLELESIAAVVIGGTSLAGGEGSVIRTVIGVFIIGLIRNAMNLLHIDTFWQDFFTGAVIILAAAMDALRTRRMKRIG